VNPQSQGQVEAETREERRLRIATSEALGYLFEAPDEHEEFEFEDFRAEIEAKGATVTLDLPEGGGCILSGEEFVNWVWELIANA
jgi:hypothetical protein